MKQIIVLVLMGTLVFAKEYLVGFAQDTFANDWRMAQVNEVKREAAKHLNLKLEVRDANADMATQISDIEYFIKNNFDFIITSPIDARITPFALKKAIDKGIKVILIDRGVEGDDFTTFIRPDNKRIAKQAAKLMVDKMDGKGTVLMLEGVQGSTPTILRREGFEEVIKEYPGIKIIKRTANFLRPDAIEVMEDIYNNKIEFDAIYSHSDSMLSGVRSVLKHKNKDSSFLMVGIDYIKEAKDAIKSKKQTASFTYPTCGAEGIQAVVDIINNKKVEKNIIIDSTKIDFSNVKEIDPIF